jgi:hypothetical protein
LIIGLIIKRFCIITPQYFTKKTLANIPQIKRQSPNPFPRQIENSVAQGSVGLAALKYKINIITDISHSFYQKRHLTIFT